MKVSLKTPLWVGLFGLCLAAPGVWAQDATAQDNPENPEAMSQSQDQMGQKDQKDMSQSGMNHSMSQHPMRQHMYTNVMGKHTMPAVVDSVDSSTGLVTVTSEQMQLKLHFPPSSLSGLKAGDHITVHLGFTKP